MKKIVLLSFLLVSLLANSLQAQPVYITKTGAKYHQGDCRYLSHSKFSIELKDALLQGYDACKVCAPAQSVSVQKNKTEPSPTTYNTPEKNAVSSQCTATTKAGSRCKRMTKITNGKCWQHGG
ncbi:hypothetical protein [Aurantibacillus circumpalustris]|uniref:hypothetical protein n=1 Tax=Aurantibacillus circumpalustris TaxID=3036359 RepID=UPI00295A64AC|nr:hypothetical protein [Aurantibacillus circumpalustris]